MPIPMLSALKTRFSQTSSTPTTTPLAKSRAHKAFQGETPQYYAGVSSDQFTRAASPPAKAIAAHKLMSASLTGTVPSEPVEPSPELVAKLTTLFENGLSPEQRQALMANASNALRPQIEAADPKVLANLIFYALAKGIQEQTTSDLMEEATRFAEPYEEFYKRFEFHFKPDSTVLTASRFTKQAERFVAIMRELADVAKRTTVPEKPRELTATAKRVMEIVNTDYPQTEDNSINGYGLLRALWQQHSSLRPGTIATTFKKSLALLTKPQLNLPEYFNMLQSVAGSPGVDKTTSFLQLHVLAPFPTVQQEIAVALSEEGNKASEGFRLWGQSTKKQARLLRELQTLLETDESFQEEMPQRIRLQAAVHNAEENVDALGRAFAKDLDWEEPGAENRPGTLLGLLNDMTTSAAKMITDLKAREEQLRELSEIHGPKDPQRKALLLAAFLTKHADLPVVMDRNHLKAVPTLAPPTTIDVTVPDDSASEPPKALPPATATQKTQRFLDVFYQVVRPTHSAPPEIDETTLPESEE
jgi:hypothetical protein